MVDPIVSSAHRDARELDYTPLRTRLRRREEIVGVIFLERNSMYLTGTIAFIVDTVPAYNFRVR